MVPTAPLTAVGETSANERDRQRAEEGHQRGGADLTGEAADRDAESAEGEAGDGDRHHPSSNRLHSWLNAPRCPDLPFWPHGPAPCLSHIPAKRG
jgi:hypothetical protein